MVKENINHIIDACRSGDDRSRRYVYEHYKGFALSVVFRFIYRYDKAVDVMNDGFVKMFGRFHDFKLEDAATAEPQLMGWMKRIMINTAIDELRRNKMTPEIGGIPDQVFDLTNTSDNADTAVLYKDVIKMLKQLPPLYRSIFNLYVIDGYTHMEIADLLGISVGTSKSGLSRARVQLQNQVRQMEENMYVAAR